MIESFSPVCHADSRILILGTMASRKSLQEGFYYMHPQNRFWRVIAALCGRSEIPATIDGKTDMLQGRGIALADILLSCERAGSLDAAIKNYTVRDLPALLAGTSITHIFCNGKTAYRISCKSYPDLTFHYLPSTSPANAAHFDLAAWNALAAYLP
ncbi:MAG: DNA-deoxyinosine glycosylase [Clostridiales bacterium]|jgi:hypoxanthine-DNA glycosylase|nr:DNA-deoxyinosine glycosylase [Clostridiales bacterium]